MGVIEQFAEIRHQEGVEEGKEIGLEKGKEIGLEKGKEESVRILLANTTISPEKIAALVGVPVSLVRKIKKQL